MSATTDRYGEIEVGIHRLHSEAYEVELRVTDPDSQAEIAPIRRPANISLETLRASYQNPTDYGRMLTDQLFFHTDIRAFYGKNKVAFEAKTPPMPLRFRLLVGPSVPELHSVRWELMLDPETHQPLATSERVLFSRVMLHQDWRVVTLRPKTKLKALIAVSAPTDCAKWKLAEVKKSAEIDRARRALTGIESTILGDTAPLTLANLHAAIKEEVDIVYLVCHGAMPNARPCLYLQKEDGTAHPVPGSELAAPIGEFKTAPRLVVLASCESAGTEAGAFSNTEAAHSALAPLLADAGVPAVLAMQGKISMDTIERAMPVFFRQLLVDGQIDRALAAARFAVRDHRDHWMPALFLRLKSGRIWYEPGFGGGSKSEFEQWKSICSEVRKGKFIPILGPEFGEHVFGGTRELANRLAEEHAFPLAPWERADLAKVAQYISTKHKREYVQDAVQNQFLRQITNRLDPSQSDTTTTLPELLDLATARCVDNPDDPYRLLVDLPASIYLNASYEPVLFKSLLKTPGKTPERIFTSWRGKAVPKRPQPKSSPSKQNPWVYHIFGLFGQEYADTMVLTEDDFFDYLIATTKLDLLLPTLTGQLVHSSLLFLGFRLDDWRFRVLFRMIVTSEGAESMKTRSHVGVQVNPDEQSMADVERARKYMEGYFQGGGYAPEISIYWGSVAEFLKELKHCLAETEKDQVIASPTGGNSGW